jgi:hypothetical protein
MLDLMKLLNPVGADHADLLTTHQAPARTRRAARRRPGQVRETRDTRHHFQIGDRLTEVDVVVMPEAEWDADPRGEEWSVARLNGMVRAVRITG